MSGASNITYSTLFTFFMFAAFHNQSPLLTMVQIVARILLYCYMLKIIKILNVG